jgi:hypothetical protein
MCSLKIFSKNWWFSLAEVTSGQLCHCASKMAVSWLGRPVGREMGLGAERWVQDIPTSAFFIGQIWEDDDPPWGLPDTQGESVVMICYDLLWPQLMGLQPGWWRISGCDPSAWRLFGSCELSKLDHVPTWLTWYIPWPWIIRISAAPWREKNCRKLIEFRSNQLSHRTEAWTRPTFASQREGLWNLGWFNRNR